MSFFSISKTNKLDNSMPYLHSHDYYELYFQIDGFRSYFCDNKYYELSSNTLIVSSPKVLHKFENGPYERILISVSPDFFSNTQLDFLNSLSSKMLIKLSHDMMGDIQKTLNELLKLNDSFTQDRFIKISLNLGLLFHQIYSAEMGKIEPTQSLKQEFTNTATSPTVLKIMNFVQKNYNKKFSLDDLCNEYNLSKTWLCKSFLKANNMTIFEYKTACQINEAKKLLTGTKLSIEKIAKHVGFSSSRHFSATFKKHVDITPLHWKRKFVKKK